MVKGFRFFLFVIFLYLPLFGVQVKVELDKNTLKVGQEVQGTLFIQHLPSEIIDTSAIKLGDAPLKVVQVSDEAVGNFKNTAFIFNLPPQPQGLQLLPAISVPVGGKSYETVPQSYLIQENEAVSPGGTNKYGKVNSVWLKLETFIEGKSTLFPGQRTIIGYRYIFNGNVQLDAEFLPLLEAEGFKKIGEPVVKDYKEKRYAVRQVFQEIEAVKAGEYQFPESTVSGNVYQLDSYGNSVLQGKISASAPKLTIKVLAFPGNPPTSFNGAIGVYTFAVRLLSLPELSVGDKVTLSLEITGKGNLDDVPMPEVCCQPGFSGVFQQSDIPPIGVVKGDTKAFVVDLRPLSDKVTEIPSAEFSFYNPETQKYVSLRSQPIPITVHPADTPFNQALQDANPPIAPADSGEGVPSSTPKGDSTPQQMKNQAIEISGNAPMYSSDLSDRSFGTWWVLFIVPIGAFLLWLQVHMKKLAQVKKEAETQQSSKKWLEKAYMEQDTPSKLHHDIERALISLLKEKGIISNENISSHDLSSQGVAGDVKAFLSSIEERRFTGHTPQSPQEILTEAQRLYDDIK